MNHVLGYREFKGFCDCIGRDLSYQDFIREYLEKYQSTDKGGLGGEEGLTLNGFKDFFLDELNKLIELTNDESQSEVIIFKWLEALGYDQDLYPVRSRLFVLSLHSDNQVNVDVRDAVQTDLDLRTNLLVIDKFGQE